MDSQIPLLDIFFRLGIACILGAIVGLDRELQDRPAGLHTHMMAALALGYRIAKHFKLSHIRSHKFLLTKANTGNHFGS